MRAAHSLLVVVLALPLPLLAQGTPGPGPGPRLEIRSCALADSLLGPTDERVLRAEVYGRINDSPQSIAFHARTTRSGGLPTGYLTVWLPSSILEKAKAQGEPMTLVLDDTLTLPITPGHGVVWKYALNVLSPSRRPETATAKATKAPKAAKAASS